MAIAFLNSTSFVDNSIVDTSVATTYTVNVGDCVIVVVSRTGIAAVSAPTDNGASGGNTYTLSATYTAANPLVAIYTTIATKNATQITCNWTAGSRTSGAFARYSGVASIGSNTANAHTTATATAGGISACTLANATNWAVLAESHIFSGGAPSANAGNLRVTSSSVTLEQYLSLIDNTGSTSVGCTDTWATVASTSSAYIELVASGAVTPVSGGRMPVFFVGSKSG